MAKKQKKWNAYIMLGNLKFYLKRTMTTTEACKWLEANCKIHNNNYFMCGTQVFCESK